MRKTFSILFTIAALFAATTSQAVILKDIGTGTDYSNLYIQFSDPTYEAVHFRYFYDYDADTPVTGAQMIYNISVASGSGLSFIDNGEDLTLGNFWAVYEITYDTSSQFGTFADPDYWNYYVAGGTGVVYSQDSPYGPVWGPGGDGDYTFDAIAAGSWSSANVGAASRVIAPDSWDGWTFGEWPGPEPTISPVPEPSTWALLGVTLLLPLACRFRKHFA